MYYVDQVDIELTRDLPASVLQVLGLNTYATMPRYISQ